MPTALSPRSENFERPMSVVEAARLGRSDGPDPLAPRFSFTVPSYGPRLHSDLRLDPGNLPLGTRLELTLPARPAREGPASLFGFARTASDQRWSTVALVIGRDTSLHRPTIAGLRSPPEQLEATIAVELPRTARPGLYLFGVEHWIGNALMDRRAFSFRIASGRAA
jgi:hypothetical protein